MPRFKKPKHPRSAYIYFVKDYQKRLKKQSANITFGEASKLCAAKWKHLPEECKEKYKKMAMADSERYRKEIQNFTPAQLKMMKRRRDPCAPPRPLSAYMWFCKHNWKKAMKCHANLNFANMMKKLGRLWACLDRKSREKYDAMAELDKKCYEIEKQRYRSAKNGLRSRRRK